MCIKHKRSRQFHSSIKTERYDGKFQLLPSLLPVWQRADALLQQMFTPSPSSSVYSVVPSAQVVTVELLVWPTGSWHVREQDTKNLDLLNSTPPNGLSSLSLLRLHFQSSLGSLTPWKVYLCDAQPSEYSSHLVSYNSTGQERHIGIILRLTRGFSTPLRISIRQS